MGGAPGANTALQQHLLLIPKEPGSGRDLPGCLSGQMVLLCCGSHLGFSARHCLHLPKPASHACASLQVRFVTFPLWKCFSLLTIPFR